MARLYVLVGREERDLNPPSRAQEMSPIEQRTRRMARLSVYEAKKQPDLTSHSLALAIVTLPVKTLGMAPGALDLSQVQAHLEISFVDVDGWDSLTYVLQLLHIGNHGHRSWPQARASGRSTGVGRARGPLGVDWRLHVSAEFWYWSQTLFGIVAKRVL